MITLRLFIATLLGWVIVAILDIVNPELFNLLAVISECRPKQIAIVFWTSFLLYLIVFGRNTRKENETLKPSWIAKPGDICGMLVIPLWFVLTPSVLFSIAILSVKIICP